MFWSAQETLLGLVLGKILGETIEKEKEKRIRTISTFITKQ